MNKIIVGIFSCEKNAEKRRACRETWVSKKAEGVEAFFASAKGEPGENDLVSLDVPDDYFSLAEKVQAFFKWALLRDDWEWLAKCDDDTYLDLERLSEFVEGLSRDSFAGNDHIFKKSGFAGGGSGYVLHRSMIEPLARDPELLKKGLEDQIISARAIKLGAKPWPTPKLWYCKSRIPTSDNKQITCHRVRPHEMAAIHSIRYAPEMMRRLVVNAAWSDTLVFYQGGGFRQLNRGAGGAFEGDENEIILHWFEWPPERLRLEWVCRK